MPLLRRSGSCCDVSQAVPPSYSGSAGSKRSTAAAGQSTQVMLGSLIAIISIRTALAIMSIRTARAWLRAAARAPRSVPGRLRANFVKALYGRACRMTHAHVHAGSCRGVYTQEKHRSQARLRPTGLGRWTGCEKELFGICCVLCVGRGGEPPSVREKATAREPRWLFLSCVLSEPSFEVFRPGEL